MNPSGSVCNSPNRGTAGVERKVRACGLHSCSGMDQQTQRMRIDIAPAAIVKVIAAVAIDWDWLHVWQLFMLLLVAIVVAGGLDPIVCWLERRRLSRALAAARVFALFPLLILCFF